MKITDIEILSESPLNAKALFLTLASSGMRIGECLMLRFRDFDFENRTIQIPGQFTKSGDSRTVFYSQECADVLKEYLGHREEFLQRSIDRSRFTKVEDDRIFPMSPQNAYNIWQRSLNRTKLNGRDSTTNRNKLHPHVLRKWFRTILGPVLPTDIVEALMGHEGYLTDVYRKYSIEQLAEFYKQGEQALTVFTESGNRLRLSKIEEENAILKRKLEDLSINGSSKDERVTELEARLKKLQDDMERLYYITADKLLKGERPEIEKLYAERKLQKEKNPS